MATAQTIVNDALREIGVLAEEETPSADMANNAFRALNRMMESLSNEASFAYVNSQISKVIAGETSFTLGPTGTWVTDRPIEVDTATCILNGITYPVKVIDSQEWDSLSYKTSTGSVPEVVYYEPNMPNGTLYLWPITTGATLYLRTTSVVNSFASLATILSMPPGYEEALIKNLAVNLHPQYPTSNLSPITMRLATKTLADIKDKNKEVPMMTLDYGMSNIGGIAKILRG
jgi:hypothetical protein